MLYSEVYTCYKYNQPKLYCCGKTSRKAWGLLPSPCFLLPRPSNSLQVLHSKLMTSWTLILTKCNRYVKFQFSWPFLINWDPLLLESESEEKCDITLKINIKMSKFTVTFFLTMCCLINLSFFLHNCLKHLQWYPQACCIYQQWVYWHFIHIWYDITWTVFNCSLLCILIEWIAFDFPSSVLAIEII